MQTDPRPTKRIFSKDVQRSSARTKRRFRTLRARMHVSFLPRSWIPKQGKARHETKTRRVLARSMDRSHSELVKDWKAWLGAWVESELESVLPSTSAAAVESTSETLRGTNRETEERSVGVPPRRPSAGPHTHLVVLVNGLLGNSSNWECFISNLEADNRTGHFLLHPSRTNNMFGTYEGIDVCGQRLVEEIQEVVAENPGLQHISLVGHSMGGLLARWAVGKLYDTKKRTVAGLQPAHFMTLATPHLGCSGESAQPNHVPFIAWTPEPLGKYLEKAAVPFAGMFLKRTGEHFFLKDGLPLEQAVQNVDAGPLLFRMCHDCAEAPYLSALRAFHTRTCYANVSGDYLVAWANSAICHPSVLKTLEGLQKTEGGCRFIVSDDGLSAATERCLQLDDELVSPSRTESVMLRNLNSMPWRRVHVDFKETVVPLLAHNHIQVTRRWLNWEGEEFVKEVVKHILELEQSWKAFSGDST